MTRTHCSLLAYVALMAAMLRIPEGAPFYDPVSLLLVLAALMVTLIGVRLSTTAAREAARWPVVALALGCFTLAELCGLYESPPSVYARDDRLAWPGRAGIVVLGLLAVSYAWRRMPGARWRFPVILTLYGLLTAGLVRSWQVPGIDVWILQQEGAAHLLRGENPYAAEYRNPYADAEFIGPELLKDGKIQSFPYPPLSLLLVAPGYRLGRDVRWALLAAVLVTAVIMVGVGRQLGLPAGHPAELAAVAFLCQPRGWFVLEMAWTEPLVMLGIVAGVWSMATRQGRLSGLLLAAVAMVKQYGILWLFPAWAAGRVRGRDLLWGAVAAAAIVLPFAAWGPAAFWRGVVGFHVYSPFREDSLSVLAAIRHATGYQPSPWWGFAAAGVIAWLVIRQPARGLTQALLGGAAVLLAFFTFNKAAHLNYYWLAASVLALAILVAAAEGTRSQTPVA